ncbi:MAG: ATP-dependent nuclease, partial [Chitinophagales bacterium]
YDESTQEARYYWQDYSIRGSKSTFDRAKTYKASVILEIPTHIINFPADLKYENIAQKENYKITDKKVIDLAHESLGDIWNIILDEIKIYQEKSLIFRQEISRVAESFNADIKEIQKVVRKFENWKKKNASPIEVIAEKCIDFLLKPLNLRVKRESDIQSKEEIGFIKIEDFDGNEIPHGLLSTGTKQILYSALPLYLLKPRNTIILFDEPERSLYPDMQRMIIDFYSSLTQDSQFFYATHSPIIASSFEPWEIIELKLDENGYVYQDLYYKGERHVDNYHIYPQYLDYDTMLKNVFDLKETRPQIGIDKIGDVLMYKNHLFKLKKEGKTNTKEFKDLFDKYKRLAEQVAWDFNVLEDEKN